MKTKPLTIFFLILFLMGCSTESNLSPILTSSCEPPCWQNIIPGKTTYQELIVILGALSSIDKNSISPQNDNSAIYDQFVGFRLTDGDIYIRAHLSKERVLMISFQDTLNLTIGQIIDKVGEPESVLIMLNPGGFAVNLLEPSQGILYGYQVDSSQSEIQPSVNVAWVNYFDPNIYELLLSDQIYSREIKKLIRPWSGYGVIKDKYLP